MFKRLLVFMLVFVILSILLISCDNNRNIKDSPAENIISSELDLEESKDIENLNSDIKRQTELEELAKINPAINRGNILTVGINSFEGVFNPILYRTDDDASVINAIFNGLVKVNEKAEYVPDLARWEISEDKLTYTFFIKQGVKFHNGEELTSADVEFTYYAIADPDYTGPRKSTVNDIVGVNSYRTLEVDVIKGIKVIDDYTISFTIKEKNVNKIADFIHGIMNETYYSNNSLSKLNNYPMGTGPMKFDTYEVDKYIKFITNENYFEGRPNIDGMIYKILPEATIAAAISNGDIDIAEVSANIENYNSIAESGIAEIQEYPGDIYRYLGFNLRLPKFQDKRTRQALMYGLNLAEFIDVQWESFATPCLAPISPVSWAYPESSSLNDYSYNQEKAAALLAEAGWSDTDGDGYLDMNGEKFTIEWTSYTDVDWKSYTDMDWSLNLIELAKESWGELGIEVESDLMEFVAVVELVYDKQDFEIYNMGWPFLLNPNPAKIFGQHADTLSDFNSVGFHHKRANEIFKLANEEYDQEKRAELYHEWAVIANDELPYLFISIANKIEGVNNRVHNLNLDTLNTMLMQVLDIELDYLDN